MGIKVEKASTADGLNDGGEGRMEGDKDDGDGDARGTSDAEAYGSGWMKNEGMVETPNSTKPGTPVRAPSKTGPPEERVTPWLLDCLRSCVFCFDFF